MILSMRRSSLGIGAFALLCILSLSSVEAIAQNHVPSADTLAMQRMRPRVGLFAHVAINLHGGNHYGLPEVPTCLPFDSSHFSGGNGIGGDVGLLFELPLTEMFALMVRGGYYGMSADETIEVGIAPVLLVDEAVEGFSAYSFNSSLATINADVTLGIRPFEFPLTFRVGPEFGAYMSTETSQDERAVRPAEMVFIGANGENTKIRNPYTTTFTNTALRVAGLIGADYELPLNAKQTLLLVPELWYSLAFTDVRDDMDWTANQFRIGAAIKYSFALPEPPPPPVIPPPPPEPMLAAALDITSVSLDGVEKQDVPIRVEEFINTQTRAFLNYVFFEDGSAEIPERYVVYLEDARRRFNTAELHNKSKLEVYYQSLNVLGSRMIEYPDSKITLTGTNNNLGVEQNNLELSRKRAEVVRDYLVRAWGIDTKRIAIAARNLPLVPSNVDSADGIEENRRVEVGTDWLELIAPVITTDTMRTIDPPIIRMRTTQTVDAGGGQWTITLVQGDRVIGRVAGEGTPESSIDFNILDDPERTPMTEEPIVASYEQSDSRGEHVLSSDQARVDQVTIQRKREEQLGDVIYENYNLITFEFDKSTLSPINRRIADIIKSRIRPTSEVQIIGYTDRLGMADHNLELSRSRALSTAAALGVPAANSTGAGEDTTMFDNELPEGRFLSRTVDVKVVTRLNPGE